MIITRELRRDEIAQIWKIDRREVIENVYYLENGALILKPEHYDMQGWPPGAALGATVAYVGSDQAFYRAIGFEKVYHSECWVKHLG